MNKFVKSLVIGGAILASTSAFAAPKGGMYGIAGVGFNGYASAVSPVTVELGAGQKINKDVSAELVAAVTPGGTISEYTDCKATIGPQVGVAARGLYHLPVDFAGVKPYVGAGVAYYMAPSYKWSCGVLSGSSKGWSGFSGIGLDYTLGVEYPMNNKTKLYFDAGGVGANWGGSIGAKMNF